MSQSCAGNALKRPFYVQLIRPAPIQPKMIVSVGVFFKKLQKEPPSSNRQRDFWQEPLSGAKIVDS